ncbi:unnamed protein product [Eruca vesicaria subsp. sativa]|uniref:F-box domain-containing protein n=1 Tax=Eruca vesicaria subsp. sativa TaxID=29727 RepID=A0ABC8LCT6_ERUVS|nr:unnamed protein product [Eruca vesicaria subsp. sativa]
METQRMKLTKGNLKSDSLPVDLMMEILKRLPVKTLIRFLSVSKLWASTIRSRDFMNLFMKVSLTRPKGLHFLFGHRLSHLDDISSVLSQNAHESYSFTNVHVTGNHTHRTSTSPSVHGLFCYKQSTTRLVIYNPCTRRSITLPEIHTRRRRMIRMNYYLGYDPIDNDYKLLCITIGGTHNLATKFRVLTVGKDNSWRVIENNIGPQLIKKKKNIGPHAPFGQGRYLGQEVCISGVLYYQALYGTRRGVMCFDVRSEKLYFIKGPSYTSSKLTSYEGKLGIVIFFEENVLRLYTLEDAAREKWCVKNFVLPTTVQLFNWYGKLTPTTETDTGEIIFAPQCLHASECSLPYYDMKTKSAKTINIQGLPERYYVTSVSSGMVENLMFL